ncbi:MAG: GNAT family N-acetyltransferase [Desulfobacter sp.]|nr:GNAT family N-acetyltransferase [Desulfobacter sp.]WDP86909.1 MAG: GNAT family N-acetyltransferase [Desulfobacter sp.]
MNYTNQIEIDEFSMKYEDDILNLIVNIQQKEFGIDITAADQPDLCNIKGFYQVNKGNFWVALFNKKMVGTVSLLDIGHKQAALRKMFVNKRYRGNKYQVAQALLHTLLNWAQSNGIREIYLGTTPKFLAAHSFYGKNGFNEIAKRYLPSSFPIMKVDNKFYKYEL